MSGGAVPGVLERCLIENWPALMEVLNKYLSPHAAEWDRLRRSMED